MPKIKFTIITLFQEALEPYLNVSMMWKAKEKGIAKFNFVNLRDFGLGPHKSVDDKPYGGGDGMLLRCEPVFAAIESVKSLDPTAKVILPTPAGALWTQDLARYFASTANEATGTADFVSVKDGERGITMTSAFTANEATGTADFVSIKENPHEDFREGEPRDGGREPEREQKQQSSSFVPKHSKTNHYIILCPHYEGYDERIMQLVDYPISLGKYVLTGGELPALIIIDSIVRLLPGVLGGKTSAEIESFSDGDTLEYPQYTKPFDFRGATVPEILLSGNHGEIAKWRAAHSKKANY